MSNKPSTFISNYINQYGHAIDVSRMPRELSWQYVLILPVCGESPQFWPDLLKQTGVQSVLVIMLVNRPELHENTGSWQKINAELIEFVVEKSRESYSLEQHELLIDVMGHDVLLINFNDQPFNKNKGVGLARKIAADTAVKLIENKHIINPWIYSTDADVILPKDYFNCITRVTKETLAISLPFKHIHQGSISEKTQAVYDFKLYYYQLGMKYIGSKYDFIPLGSTIVVHVNAYTQVRGFPTRAAGEDFYLLNKLAKVTAISSPTKPVVEINSRSSDRVPFGTGPAVNQIEKNSLDGIVYKYYHPRIFIILNQWLKQLKQYPVNKNLPRESFGLNQYWKLEDVLSKAEKQYKTKDNWQQFFHEWFDAFKTLKSVHFLKSTFGSLSYDELKTHESYQEVVGQWFFNNNQLS